MCNTCAVKRVQSSNDGVFIIDEENNIIKSVGNGTVSSIAPVSLKNGPPTMVQLQRTTNNSIGKGMIFFSNHVKGCDLF